MFETIGASAIPLTIYTVKLQDVQVVFCHNAGGPAECVFLHTCIHVRAGID